MTSSIVARMSKKRRIPDGGTVRTRSDKARSARGGVGDRPRSRPGPSRWSCSTRAYGRCRPGRAASRQLVSTATRTRARAPPARGRGGREFGLEASGRRRVLDREPRRLAHRMPVIWRCIITNDAEPEHRQCRVRSGVRRAPPVAHPLDQPRAARPDRLQHEGPRRLELARRLRPGSVLEAASPAGSSFSPRTRPRLHRRRVPVQDERSVRLEEPDLEAAARMGRHDVAHCQVLPGLDDPVGALSAHVELVDAVPAAPSVAHLHEPRPDALGRRLDRDPARVGRLGVRDQLVARQRASSASSGTTPQVFHHCRTPTYASQLAPAIAAPTATRSSIDTPPAAESSPAGTPCGSAKRPPVEWPRAAWDRAGRRPPQLMARAASRSRIRRSWRRSARDQAGVRPPQPRLARAARASPDRRRGELGGFEAPPVRIRGQPLVAARESRTARPPTMGRR